MNSALKDIEQQLASIYIDNSRPYVSPIEPLTPAIKKPVKSGLWREHCEDDSRYGLYPENFATADNYEDALNAAKESETAHPFAAESMSPREDFHPQQGNKYRWRNHCEDESDYGINPEDYETADDYQDALDAKKRENK